MKIFATFLFGGGAVFLGYCAIALPGTFVPGDIPMLLYGIVCGIGALFFVWVYTDTAGNGPPLGTGMNLPEWRRELAERRCRAAQPEALDFRTDEERAHDEAQGEADQENEEIEELPGMASRMGLRVRVPGKH